MNTYWLSFSGEHGNLGVAIVDADSIADAITKAHNLGINPGGEVLGIEVPDEGIEEVRRLGKDRLITKAEMQRRGYETVSVDHV